MTQLLRKMKNLLEIQIGEIWVEGRSQPVADPDGMTWHGVLTDITERKRADRAVADRLEMEARLR